MANAGIIQERRSVRLKSFNIKLTSINDVKLFVATANDQGYEIDLVSGRYIIDAKSIMGIFSLDLAKPIRVEIHASDEEAAAFSNLVKKYTV